MLYLIGSLAIKVAPFNAHEVTRTGATDYAIKAVAGAEQPLEFVGEGANDLTFTGTLFPRELGGLNELDLLRQMRISGKPQYVMRGDGTPLGWYAILSVAERSTYLDSAGVGKQIDMTITLKRAQAPSQQSYFSLATLLFA